MISFPVLISHAFLSDYADLMEAPVTCEEIGDAIDSLKTNKSPSLDGLMVELYK